uniref:CARD domain-containing protein n=1 Tax=Plectus sambesii TaxID=2011161 RepID=A0A914VB96_9BILA
MPISGGQMAQNLRVGNVTPWRRHACTLWLNRMNNIGCESRQKAFRAALIGRIGAINADADPPLPSLHRPVIPSLMEKEHKDALERSLHDICQDLDAEEVLPYLRSKGIVKEGQAKEIMKITRKSTQNMELIDYIKGAGPSAFQDFISYLQSCNKEHLAEKILAHLPSSSSQHLKSPKTVPQNNASSKNAELSKKQSNPPAAISKVNSTPVGSNQGPPSKGPDPYPVLCQFCKVELTSQAHADEHNKGRKHLNKKAAAEGAK